MKLSGTTVMKMNGKDISIEKAYNYAVNRAAFEVQQGVFDFNTAIRSTIKELADSGVRTVDYESGYSRNLMSAVRMNVADSIRTLNANYRETQASQYGADKVFVSWHAMVAPDHAQINGMEYTKKKWEEISAGLKRQVGEMNCHHYLTYGIDGISEPYRDWETDRKSTRLNSSHEIPSRMPSSA